MVKFLAGKVSDRKLRLLGVAFCRRIWRLLPDDSCREAVRVAERYADGLATDRERQAVRRRAAHPPASERLAAVNARGAVVYLNEKTAGKYPYFVTGVAAVAHAAADKYQGDRQKAFPLYRAAYRAAERAEARLVRCVAGNPFRPVALDPGWLTPDVRSLAQGAYEKRALPAGTLEAARLALLADALEEAGCTDAAVLAHLRGPGPHVRGCRPVDLLFGKE
jgi:hypothetical protein